MRYRSWISPLQVIKLIKQKCSEYSNLSCSSRPLHCATSHWLPARRWWQGSDPPPVSSPGPDPLVPAAARGLLLGQRRKRVLFLKGWLNLWFGMRELYSHLSKMRLVSMLLYLTSCLNSCRQRKNPDLKQLLGQTFKEGQKVMKNFCTVFLYNYETYV